jgi:3-phosphoshikimate 1-carboxyvinyltransferase
MAYNKAMNISALRLRGRRLNMQVPSSKSLANRALVLACLSTGESFLQGEFSSDDVQLMIRALRICGADIDEGNGGVLVRGGDWLCCGGDVDLFLGNSGTCMRFLTSVMCLREGVTVLSGSDRMHERPIGDLVISLRALGASIECIGREGYPPLRITGGGLEGGSVEVSGSISSQYVSSLLMVAPFCTGGVEMTLSDRLISKPYVDLTTNLMGKFGVGVKVWDSLRYTVSLGAYRGQSYVVEADASAASYWFALAALHNCTVTIEGIGENSSQGDVMFPDVLHLMGCGIPKRGKHSISFSGPSFFKSLMGVEVCMNTMPDMVMSLAIVAAFSKGVTRISDVGSLRVKETDRLDALEAELSRCGVEVSTGEDWIRIVGNPKLKIDRPVEIECYDDHRIAMSFAILGTRTGNIVISDPDCVKKSYPGFWEELASISI